MLGDGGDLLVQQEREREVIRVNDKGAPPQVWLPVSHNEDQGHELPLICR
jgi:hypothetical protein